MSDMPSDVRIRTIDPADEQALIRFFAEIAEDPEVMAFFHPHPLDAQTARRIALRDGIDGDIYFVAAEGSQIVGYGMLRGWDEGYEIPSLGVCVARDARGAGVGASLLSWAIDRAVERGATQVMLKVSRDNAPARHLYEKRGFWFSGEAQGDQLVGRLILNRQPGL